MLPGSKLPVPSDRLTSELPAVKDCKADAVHLCIYMYVCMYICVYIYIYIEVTKQHRGKYVHKPAIKSPGALRSGIFETIDYWEFPSCSSKTLASTETSPFDLLSCTRILMHDRLRFPCCNPPTPSSSALIPIRNRFIE